MTARRTMTLLCRGEVIVPAVSLTVVALIVATLTWWAPAWVQAQAEERDRAVAHLRTWRPDPWTITAADVPQGGVVPVEDDWLRTGWPGDPTVLDPGRVPGLRAVLANRQSARDADALEGGVQGVRSGPVDVFSRTVVLPADQGYSPLRAGELFDRLSHGVRDALATAPDGGRPGYVDLGTLAGPVLTPAHCEQDECPAPRGDGPDDPPVVTLTGVEVLPSWIEPRRVTTAVTWVEDVVVIVATVSPVGAEVPAELDAEHLLDVLAQKVRDDPPPPSPDEIEQAAVSPRQAPGGAR
ncbi:hypothetical protein ATJ88_0278 [Isoptericola jiangsuensis]|uniref:Uncharacterized protein n=1 Tax=Isoptericola jiangsuensis TaxID=548579 RepID=A0A2A9ESU2_9MICO|nr:hypothetical protein [Isoptericola jiangsuensis]PFG41636.1 hypothetical protein ATJ88_0278 [Isoptericola jiangsuensis]